MPAPARRPRGTGGCSPLPGRRARSERGRLGLLWSSAPAAPQVPGRANYLTCDAGTMGKSPALHRPGSRGKQRRPQPMEGLNGAGIGAGATVRNSVFYWPGVGNQRNFGDFLAEYLLDELFVPVPVKGKGLFIIGSCIDDLFFTDPVPPV